MTHTPTWNVGESLNVKDVKKSDIFNPNVKTL